MNIIGTCQREMVLNAHTAAAFDYLTNHKKVLEFNPICKSVRTTGLENVYRWDFEIDEPSGNLMKLMFFVEQTEWENHPKIAEENTHAVLNTPVLQDKNRQVYRICWNDHLVSSNNWVRDERTFLGHAAGEMNLLSVKESQTLVCVTMKIETDFQLPLLLRWFPESALDIILGKVMTLGMENILKVTLDNISRDFHKTRAGAVYK